MTTTREELAMFHNNVMVIMENRIMMLTGCDRFAANLAANEVLNLDHDAERLLSTNDDEE